MSKVLYLILLKPLSLLPHGILYRISDVLYFILYFLVGYRKKVVAQNLLRAFPTKSIKERQQIARNFYQHLCDIIVESVKTFTITHKEGQKRFRLKNPEALENYFENHKSAICFSAHYCNWEMAGTSIASFVHHTPIAIYKSINNAFLNDKMLETRSSKGSVLINKSVFKKQFDDYVQKQIPVIAFFLSDQSPNTKNAYWVPFFNIETAFAFGGEAYARKYDLPVFYGKITKPRRGHYEAEFILLAETLSDKPNGWAVEAFSRALETQIKEEPALWLWSHKRWKKSRDDYKR